MDGITKTGELGPALELRDVSAQIATARARFANLVGINKAFGVIRMWPEGAVAEHENVERLRDAARLIGATVIELDRYGRMLGSPGDPVTADHVDFVLHLHFETPKAYDAVSIAAMWNPMQFYSEWGFEKYWANQLSHDLFATTGSREIEKLIERERGVLNPPVLNHGVAEPIYAPTPKASYQAFYCGINWERVDGRPGRHGALLKALDARGKLDLFGPEIVQGVKAWDGYAGYRGSLPFDGKTIIRKVAESGACLVLSSEAHRASGIMSNRLFEALAGGAVVIGDDHPFIPEAIGNNFVCVPSHMAHAKRADVIIDALEHFARDPDKAARMAEAAQSCMLNAFYLPAQVVGLFEAAARWRADHRLTLQTAVASTVDIVIQPVGMDAVAITRFVTELDGKLRNNAKLILLAAAQQAEWFRRRFDGIATVVEMAGDGAVIRSPSECLDVVAPHLKSPKVAFFIGIEEIFAEEFIAGAARFASHPVGRLGHIRRHHNEAEQLCFDYQAPHDPIVSFYAGAVSAIIFDRDWLVVAPHVSGLSWQGLVRLAELQTDTIAASPSTALVLDLRQYERCLRLGFKWSPVSKDEELLIARLGSLRASYPSGLVLRRPETTVSDRRPVEPITLHQAELVSLFDQLPASEKLNMGLQIYKSLPMPRWVRGMIRLTRKLVGIR